MGPDMKKEGDELSLRYRKILRSMVFGNFTAAIQGSVVDDGNGGRDSMLPFCG